ncbi:MAG: sulfotransferase family 2 domain-containing protein [Pseudolabrys sp.]
MAGFRNPAAVEFCDNLMANGYQADSLLIVLPKHKLIYIAVPKAASTRIRKTLATVEGRHSRSLKPSRRSMYRGPYGPRNLTIDSFFRLASSPDTLRFSFVRNPYARAVSCWADKFADKPLVPGDSFIDAYLAMRQEIDTSLPAGPERTLSFSDFTVFAAATANSRHDIHLQSQDDIISMPGIKLDLIGKVENFCADFAGVLDFLNAGDDICREAAVTINESHHDDWPLHYTPELTDRIYHTYRRDFDRFGYARSIE